MQRLPERALQGLDDMREAGVRPAASTYAALLKAAATAPQWHRAYGFLSDEILDKLEGEGIAPTPDVFDALVRCAGACGDYVAARAYFDVATRFGGAPSHSRYATYLGALARAVTVGVRGGTRSRSVERAPFDGLGIGEEAAFAPAGNASVSTGEDAGEGRRQRGGAAEVEAEAESVCGRRCGRPRSDSRTCPRWWWWWWRRQRRRRQAAGGRRLAARHQPSGKKGRRPAAAPATTAAAAAPGGENVKATRTFYIPPGF